MKLSNLSQFCDVTCDKNENLLFRKTQEHIISVEQFQMYYIALETHTRTHNN